MYTGPSLTSNILNILLRFRWFKVPIISDIEKAFHMIRVDERDRDSLGLKSKLSEFYIEIKALEVPTIFPLFKDRLLGGSKINTII